MIVSNGTIEFERKIKPADYEGKGVKVVLSFGVDEGEDPTTAMQRVSDMAHAEVFRMLRKSEAVVVSTVERERGVKTPPAPTTAQEVAEANPIAPVDGSGNIASSLMEATAAVPQVTDAELTTACQRTTARMNGPEATKAVIAKFVEQPGMPVRTIPQEKRAAFVAALDALKRSEAGDY